jgi:hypothetical protein
MWGLKRANTLAGHVDAGQDASSLMRRWLFAHSVAGDATKGGMVSVTDVFGKGEVDETVFKFVY